MPLTSDLYYLIVKGIGGPGNHDVQCTFCYHATSAPIFDTVGEDLVQAWQLAAEVYFASCFSNAYAIELYSVRNPLDPTYGEDFPITLFSGGLSGDQLQGQSSCYMNLRTAKIGRRYRGGNHMWPANEASASGGVWTTTYTTQIQDFLDQAVTIGNGLTTDFYDLCIFSTANQAAELVTGGTPSLVPGTMRRRKPNVGS